MLKARLPTQQELTDLYREVENLRKDKKLKDDTIKFLQKEKEALMREVSLHHKSSPCRWETLAIKICLVCKYEENTPDLFVFLSPVRYMYPSRCSV